MFDVLLQYGVEFRFRHKILTDNGWLDSDLNCDGDGGGGLLSGVSVGRLMRIGCRVCGDGDGDGDGDARN